MADAPARPPATALQIVVENVPVRRGLLLLGPDNTQLLGGQVGVTRTLVTWAGLLVKKAT